MKRLLRLTTVLGTAMALVVGESCSSPAGSNSPALMSLSLTPKSVTLPVNGTQQLTLTGTYSNGSTQNITTEAGTRFTASGGDVSLLGVYTAPASVGSYGITATSGGKADTSHAVVMPGPEWTLMWSDEFAGGANTAPDTANWLYDIGTAYPGGAANWGTGEIETMTNSTANVYLDGDGHLAIKPIRSANGSWTSGRIETRRNDFEPPAGGILAVEASIAQPNVNGTNGLGYWPAFWMLGGPFRNGYTNWPSVGEIDIMENVNGMSSVFGTLHCGVATGGACNEPTGLGSGARACAGCVGNYHVYRVEWDRSVSPQQIRWYLDGISYFTVDANQAGSAAWTSATNHGFMIILDLAIGGGFPAAFGGGPTTNTLSSVPMLIDYVRVYQR